MSATDKLFAGSIPEIYDTYFVPLIFEPYALDLAKRVAAIQPRQDLKAVLETAAGTGVVTRALAAALPAQTRIVATDLNEPMLKHAMARHPQDQRTEWRQADALALPFDDRTFDVVACQFGAMFFPDKGKGYAEARRVLKPGGHFIFNVWDRIADNEFADVVTQALASVFPNDPPRFMARTPHGYHDADAIRTTLSAAGFSRIGVDVVTHISKAASPRDPAIAYCQGSPLRTEIETRDPAGLERATAAAAAALQRRFGSGPVEGKIQAIVFTATC
jgi:ubiquinone/menaquinone biosynthesis C-methylase UbiE